MPPPFSAHFANCLRTLAGENTAPSRQWRSAPPLPQSTLRNVFGHWLERTQHHPDSVDLLAPTQSTSRTVSSCLWVAAVSLCHTISKENFRRKLNELVMLCPPFSAHFANCLRTLAGENTHHPDSVDLLAPPQSTSRTVSSCLWVAAVSLCHTISKENFRRKLNELVS